VRLWKRLKTYLQRVRVGSLCLQQSRIQHPPLEFKTYPYAHQIKMSITPKMLSNVFRPYLVKHFYHFPRKYTQKLLKYTPNSQRTIQRSGKYQNGRNFFFIYLFISRFLSQGLSMEQYITRTWTWRCPITQTHNIIDNKKEAYTQPTTYT
jgi:hypothetical protein